MKKFTTVTVLCMLTALIFAQGPVVSPSWKVKSFGISHGYDMDMLKNLDYNYFVSTIRESENTNLSSNMDLEKEYVMNMICENPHLRANVTLLPPKLKNTELNLALVGIFNRIDMVAYATPDLNWSDPGYQSLNFYSTTNEFALEASLLKRIPLLGNTFNFYAGGGSNIGVSYGGELYVDGNNVVLDSEGLVGIYEGNEFPDYYSTQYFYENYKTKSSLSQRIFAQIGFSALFFQRVELGMEYRRGIGYRYIPDAQLRMTNLKSYGFTTKWNFR